MARAGLRVGALALLSLALLGTEAQAGAWVQSHGGYYLKLSARRLDTDEEYDYRGRRRHILEEHPAYADAAIRDVAVTAYAEYGLTHRTTAIADIAYKSLRASRTAVLGGGLIQQQQRAETSGWADGWFSVRHSLLAAPLVLAIQAGLKLPLGYTSSPDSGGPGLGSGALDGEAWVMVGKSRHPLYFSAGLGYRRRRGPLHDEVVYAAELGGSRGRVLVKIGIDGLRNTSSPPDILGRTVVTPLPGGGGVLPRLEVGDQHVAKLSPALVFTVGRGLALEAQALHTLTGENAPSGTAYSLGLVLARP